MQVERRSVFETKFLRVVHVRARPSHARAELERQDAHVLVLPLAGVFSKHEQPRRSFVAGPSHAVFIPRDVAYRISLPSPAGDECLTLRFSPAALAQLGECDATGLAPQALLPPKLMLARSLLWRGLARGEADALEVEEFALAALKVARRKDSSPGTPARRRQVRRVIDAIAVEPRRRWSLHMLAQIAGVSPWHLAHQFRADTGLSVHQYVLRARLASTLPEVLETGSDLSRIALDAGFASHSHFTSRFRAVFGHTPRALRSDKGRVRELIARS